MGIERIDQPFAAEQLVAVARDLLDAATLCAIATVTPRGHAHVNVAYFAWSPELEVVWLSDPQARHSRNLRASDSVAIVVFDSSQTWGEPDRGIQLFGAAREAEGEDARRAEEVYATRFPGYRQSDLSAYRLYLFRPRRVKLFDEPALGEAIFVTATVGAGGAFTWEATERYRSTA